MIPNQSLLHPDKEMDLTHVLQTAMAGPVHEATLSVADQWFWGVLKTGNESASNPLTSPIPVADWHEPALLMGLLAGQRTGWGQDFNEERTGIESELLTWLDHQLTSTQPNLAACLRTFQYLISSQTTDHRLAELLAKLKVLQPLQHWNPGSDLTLESGTTGWLLMLLKARNEVSLQKRIWIEINDVDQYLSRYIDYLHTHQIPINGVVPTESIFPMSVGEQEWKIAEQQSCGQGDLGHLLLLYEADRLLWPLKLAPWADRLGGYLIFLRQTGRMPLTDIGLMTGAAGLSLLYRRLYTLTRQPQYLNEGLYWLDETIRGLQQPNRQPDDSLRSGRLGVVATLKHWLGHHTGLELLHL